MDDFARSSMVTALEDDELLTDIEFEGWPEGHGFGFEEFARRRGDFALASCGVLLTLSGSGHVVRFACVIGGLAPTPVRLRDLEAQAPGATPDADFVAAVAAAASQVEAGDDAHVSASFRRHLAGVMARRALRKALATAKTEAPQNA
jgi:carbon-monoxide dehydrogenase medium subunit